MPLVCAFLVRDNSAGIFGTRAIVGVNWAEELKAKERARSEAATFEERYGPD